MATGALTAGEVTSVTLGRRVYQVTVSTDGEDIWFTTDGTAPYEDSPVAHHVLSYAPSITVPVGGGNEAKVVKLFSTGTPTYTVTPGAGSDAPFSALDHDDRDHAGVPGVAQSGAIEPGTAGGDLYSTVSDGGTNARLRVDPSASPTGGDWTLTFDSETTTAIAFDASQPEIRAALMALGTVGDGNVTGGSGDGIDDGGFFLTFEGAFAAQPIDPSRLTADGSGLTGPDSPYTLTVTLDTPGVAEVLSAEWAPPNAPDLSAYEGENIRLTAVDVGSIEIVNEEGPKLNIEAWGHLNISADEANRHVNISASGTGGTVAISADGDIDISGGEAAGILVSAGEVNIANSAGELGFYGHAPVAQQTAVAVTTQAIHDALVALGLITAP